jgi:hypothetical protein
MIEIVKVSSLESLDGYRLRVVFSNGRWGIHDFVSLINAGGPMIEPLSDEALFRQAFISFGVPAWPNGFDVDAIALYREMEQDGTLSPPIAAA